MSSDGRVTYSASPELPENKPIVHRDAAQRGALGGAPRGSHLFVVQRFAPGFSERILARHAMTPRTLEAHNANRVGGDILGGFGNGVE